MGEIGKIDRVLILRYRTADAPFNSKRSSVVADSGEMFRRAVPPFPAGVAAGFDGGVPALTAVVAQESAGRIEFRRISPGLGDSLFTVMNIAKEGFPKFRRLASDARRLRFEE